MLEAAKPLCPRVRTIFADGGYVGPLKEWLKDTLDWDLILVRRPKFKRKLFGQEIVEPFPACDEKRGFPLLAKRWVVERTFAWLGRYRRLSKDYEGLCQTSELWIQMASARLISTRLAKNHY